MQMPFWDAHMDNVSALEWYFRRTLTSDDILAALALRREPILFGTHRHNLGINPDVTYLAGCSNQVLRSISEGAKLDSWKSKQKSSQELSAVELCNNGSRILTSMWEGHGSAQGPVGIVGDIFRCAAIIYINVIMSGNSSGMVNCLLTFL
jgi:hypothetical protein